MKKVFIASIAACVIALSIIAFVSAAEQERPFRATFAGIYTNKDDFNYTGSEREQGLLGLVSGKSTLGYFAGYLVVSTVGTAQEYLDSSGNRGTEVANTVESFVLTFEDTGELLFLKNSETNAVPPCLVPGVGGSGNTGLDVVGGTGRFDGATGHVSKPFNLISLVAPASPGKGRMDSLSGTLEGTIQLKNGNVWPF
jgi:hypothetical protein